MGGVSEWVLCVMGRGLGRGLDSIGWVVIEFGPGRILCCLPYDHTMVLLVIALLCD